MRYLAVLALLAQTSFPPGPMQPIPPAGPGVPVQPLPPPAVLPDCEPCFDVQTILDSAAECTSDLNGSCTVNPGGTSFALMSCSIDIPVPPPPTILGIYVIGNPGTLDCSGNDILQGEITGTVADAAAATECEETLVYALETTLGLAIC